MAVTARRRPELEAAAAAGSGPGRIVPVPGDVTDLAQMEGAVAAIEAEHGPVVLAFLNAGTFFRDEVAVFGVPHERLGEEVAAVVMLRNGSSVTEQDLLDHVGSRLAPFKVPSRLRITDEPLPRNAAGKFLKRDLRDLEASLSA